MMSVLSFRHTLLKSRIVGAGLQTGSGTADTAQSVSKDLGGAKLRISALRFCIFGAQCNLAIFLGIVPLNFRESQGKDMICKMLRLQA